MLEVLLLIMCGLLTIVSCLLLVAWGNIAYRRTKVIKGLPALCRDRYFVLAMGLVFSSIGSATMSISQTVSIVFINPEVYSSVINLTYLIIFGMGMLLIAKYSFVWAIDMHKQSLLWKSIAGASFGWTSFVLLWRFL